MARLPAGYAGAATSAWASTRSQRVRPDRRVRVPPVSFDWRRPSRLPRTPPGSSGLSSSVSASLGWRSCSGRPGRPPPYRCHRSAVLGRALRHPGMVGDLTFLGGMNVPRKGAGRSSATYPLARMTIGDQGVAIRPRVADTLLGDFVNALDQVRALPLTGRVLTAGVGLETVDGNTGYFWTWQQDRVLDVCEVMEFPPPSACRPAADVRS